MDQLDPRINELGDRMTENKDAKMLEITNKMTKYLGKENMEKLMSSPEQTAMLKELAQDFVEESWNDCLADRVVTKISKNLAKDVAKEVKDSTLLAYNDWRWYADASAKALIGAGTVATVALVLTKLLGGRAPVSVTHVNNENTNPFGGTGYTASPRPSIGGSARGMSAESRENLH